MSGRGKEEKRNEEQRDDRIERRRQADPDRQAGTAVSHRPAAVSLQLHRAPRSHCSTSQLQLLQSQSPLVRASPCSQTTLTGRCLLQSVCLSVCILCGLTRCDQDDCEECECD